MLTKWWEIALAIFDYRTIVRKLRRAAVVDAVFVTNFRDLAEKRRFVGEAPLANGNDNGPRCRLGNTLGRIRGIDVVTEDLLTSEGRKRARRFFLSATEWAQDNGAKVVLLAAATKRLFGRNGAQLKEQFPELVFTIGDNGTSYLLIQEVKRALELAGLSRRNAKIAVLGATGILGEQVIRALIKENCSVIGVTSSPGRKGNMQGDYELEYHNDIEQVGQVDAVVGCTHAKKLQLTAENIEHIRKSGKKLLVIDVAEPSNLSYLEYQKCQDRVIRIDAGNGYSPHFKYKLGALLTRMLHLPKGVTFGCFAEAISLAAAIRGGVNVSDRDWFQVNEDNMNFIAELFNQFGFTLPQPSCFGVPVKSFDLNLKNYQQTFVDKKVSEDVPASAM